MMSGITAGSMLAFLPLAVTALVVVALLIRRLIRLARCPGFGGRYDRELGFLNRGPRLAAAALVVLSVLPPAVLGFYRTVDHAGEALQRQPELQLQSEAESQPEQQKQGSVVTHGTPLAPAAAASTTAEGLTIPVPHPDAGPARDDRPVDDRPVDEGLIPADLAQHAFVTTRLIGPEAFTSGEWTEMVSTVDVLFVHAHPDDESIDFAVLMAALARNGARIATLLLTDGESGLDRYPRRAAFPGYADTRLAGEELREVRIQEARRALSILGSHYYLRPALPNHPYNGIADVLELDEVISAWGGRDAMGRLLREVLAVLQPRIVVAPDGPSAAREHFEHEATGYLMRGAVEQAKAEGSGPSGYLVSVDPFQREHYPRTVAVPGTIGNADLRSVQRAALSQHHTQADASVIALRRLAGIPVEYYLPVYWELGHSLGDLIGAPEPIVSPATLD